jgi:uncharacterized LabA/DUF88 family protein
MLKAAVIVDYQNVHLTSLEVFDSDYESRRNSLNPLLFATCLIEERNSRVKDERLLAKLKRVEVYRGLPSSIHDPIDNARNLEQKRRWMEDPRVQVTLRPLKYSTTRPSKANASSKGYVVKREKGIDVLCALAVVRNAQSPDIDLVVLASHDSDLEPALEEAVLLSPETRIETASWFNPSTKKGWIRLNPRVSTPIWNNRLGRSILTGSQEKRNTSST